MTAQEKKPQLLSPPSLKIYRQPKPLPLVSLPKKKKKKKSTNDSDILTIPPTQAQSDYIANGLQLPKKTENLRKLLSDMDRNGYFDNELNYLLRRKETVERIKDRIRDCLSRRDTPEEPNEPDSVQYEPLIEKSAGLFERYFLQALKEGLKAS